MGCPWWPFPPFPLGATILDLTEFARFQHCYLGFCEILWYPRWWQLAELGWRDSECYDPGKFGNHWNKFLLVLLTGTVTSPALLLKSRHIFHLSKEKKGNKKSTFSYSEWCTTSQSVFGLNPLSQGKAFEAMPLLAALLFLGLSCDPSAWWIQFSSRAIVKLCRFNLCYFQLGKSYRDQYCDLIYSFFWCLVSFKLLFFMPPFCSPTWYVSKGKGHLHALVRLLHPH